MLYTLLYLYTSAQSSKHIKILYIVETIQRLSSMLMQLLYPASVNTASLHYCHITPDVSISRRYSLRLPYSTPAVVSASSAAAAML